MVNTITEKIKEENKRHPDFTYKTSLSVSKVIGYVSEEFDTEGMAKSCSEKYFNTQGHKYYQKTPEMILEMWETKREASLKKGRSFDSLVEQVLEIRDQDKWKLWQLDHSYTSDTFLQNAHKGLINVLTLMHSGKFEVIGTEIQLFVRNKTNPNEIVNGRCDCLLYSPVSNTYMIIDWKTNDQIKTKNNFNKLLGPLDCLDDCDFIKYMIQLSFYKKALVETYHLTDNDHVSLCICQMGRNENGYSMYTPALGYTYNSDLLDKAIEYAFIKHKLKNPAAVNNSNVTALF